MFRQFFRKQSARPRSARPTARLAVECLEDRTVPANLPTGFTESLVASGLASPTAMECEVVRDSLLALAGRLDTTMGGPSLAENLGLSESRRRSVYFRLTTEHKMLFLELFDLASPNECYERRDSVVPQQALALTNSVLALNQSRLMARSSQAPDDAAFVLAAFEQVLGRTPTRDEQVRCERFLREQKELLKNSGRLTPFPADGSAAVAPSADVGQRSRENLVHVLVNHNDFVTIR